MFLTAKKASAVAIVVIVSAAISLVAVGCSGTDDSTTTTTATGVSTTATVATDGTGSTQADTTGTTKLVDDGGKTSDQYAAEIPDLQKAVDANPTDLAALQALAVAQYNSKNYEAAAGTYLKMLAISDVALTHNNYGNVLRDWKKTDEAKAQYELAIAADPTLVVAYLNLGAVYALENNKAEAIKVADRGIAATTGADQTRLKNYKAKLTAPPTTTTSST